MKNGLTLLWGILGCAMSDLNLIFMHFVHLDRGNKKNYYFLDVLTCLALRAFPSKLLLRNNIATYPTVPSNMIYNSLRVQIENAFHISTHH